MNFTRLVVFCGVLSLGFGAPASELPQGSSACSCLLGQLLLTLSDLVKNNKSPCFHTLLTDAHKGHKCPTTTTTLPTTTDEWSTDSSSSTTESTTVSSTVSTTVSTVSTTDVSSTPLTSTTTESTSSTTGAAGIRVGSGYNPPGRCPCPDINHQFLYVPLLRFEGKPDKKAFQFYLDCLFKPKK